MNIDIKNPDLRIALFFIVFIFEGIFMFIDYLRTNSDLKDDSRMSHIETEFKDEIKKITLPPKTAINKSEGGAKNGIYISITNRYRTELSQQEFQNSLRKELEKNKWKYYLADSDAPFVITEHFCRDKFDANLSLEYRSIWNDNADYYQLTFALYKNPHVGQEERPTGCQ